MLHCINYYQNKKQILQKGLYK